MHLCLITFPFPQHAVRISRQITIHLYTAFVTLRNIYKFPQLSIVGSMPNVVFLPPFNTFSNSQFFQLLQETIISLIELAQAYILQQIKLGNLVFLSVTPHYPHSKTMPSPRCIASRYPHSRQIAFVAGQNRIEALNQNCFQSFTIYFGSNIATKGAKTKVATQCQKCSQNILKTRDEHKTFTVLQPTYQTTQTE